jgi:hypothetical protein
MLDLRLGFFLPMPVGSVLRDRFLVALAQGFGNEDWSAIAHTLPHKHANGR